MIAGIIIDSQFSHLLWDSNLQNLRKAMYIATVGDGYRNGGLDGDNLYPVYSNVSLPIAFFQNQLIRLAMVHALRVRRVCR